MSTITLYANKVNQMSSLLGDVRTSVNSLKSDLDDLRVTIVAIDSTICNLDDIISSIRSSSDTQERKSDTLNAVSGDADVFVSDVVTVDEAAAEAITTGEDDFYDEYPYLKPEDESLLDTILGIGGDVLDLLGDAFELAVDVLGLGWDILCEGLSAAWEWCKDHWKEILLTVVIIVGVVLTIVAVVASGGLALVPLLTALGMSASLAATVSMVVGAAAIVFAVGSGIVNIVDVWHPLEGAWKTVQSFLNWGNLICGGLYNIGCIYNSLHGITNAQLKAFGEALKNPDFATALKNSAGFRSLFRKVGLGEGESMLWSGLQNGSKSADVIAANNGRVALNTIWEQAKLIDPAKAAALDALDPNWSARSIAYVLESSGGIKAFLGSPTGTWITVGGANKLIGDVFLNYESIVAPITPGVTGLTVMGQTSSGWSATSGFFNATYSISNFTRTFQSIPAVRSAIALGETFFEWLTN